MSSRKLASRPPELQPPLFPGVEPPAAPRPPRVQLFAYGSNVDFAQMSLRCPSARLLGAATLDDHAMAFAGHSATRGGPVATVFACEGLEVPGALYSVTADDLRILDRYEGVPWMYGRTVERVRTVSGPRRQAAVYRLHPDQMALGTGDPEPAYLEQIVAAYRNLGLPPDALEVALLIGRRSRTGTGSTSR